MKKSFHKAFQQARPKDILYWFIIPGYQTIGNTHKTIKLYIHDHQYEIGGNKHEHELIDIYSGRAGWIAICDLRRRMYNNTVLPDYIVAIPKIEQTADPDLFSYKEVAQRLRIKSREQLKDLLYAIPAKGYGVIAIRITLY